MTFSAEKKTGRLLIVAGCLLAAIGVAFGAIGAHFLEKWLANNFEDNLRREDIWDAGVRYQMYCAFGLIAIGLASGLFGAKGKLAGVFMFAGALLFSGCLYGYVLTNVKPLVHIVPLGGFSMIIAWVLFGWSMLKAKDA